MKKIWINNKFVICISIILLMCFLSICYVASTYFFRGSDTVYGERLDDLSDYEIKKSEVDGILAKIEENESVLDSSIETRGKVIYIITNYNEVITLEEAQRLAATNLENFDEETLGYFDINYIVKSVNFTKMGYKNSASANIVWNNNTSFEVVGE